MPVPLRARPRLRYLMWRTAEDEEEDGDDEGADFPVRRHSTQAVTRRLRWAVQFAARRHRACRGCQLQGCTTLQSCAGLAQRENAQHCRVRELCNVLLRLSGVRTGRKLALRTVLPVPATREAGVSLFLLNSA